MSFEDRYILNEESFLEDAYLALEERFQFRSEFDAFYASLPNNEVKNEFLRVGTAYLFFAKRGDWHVDVPRSNSVVDYFTNSFKLVAIIGIIESLSQESFVDFYQWLSKKEDAFPIPTRNDLEPLYHEYKGDFGSIRRCKRFFLRLPLDLQERLRSAVKLNNSPAPSIEKVVDLIYRVRSSFAHDSQSSVEIGGGFVFDQVDGKRVMWNFPINLLFESFEKGLLLHFEEQIQQAGT